jgi:hypothetical protein
MVQADCRLFSSIGLIGLRERGVLLHRGSPHLGEAYHDGGIASAQRQSGTEVALDSHEGARGWFVLWEGSIRADLSGGFCRDLFNQIIDLGEPIKTGMMTAAEDVERRTLSLGDIRAIRRQYTMDWDGWALTPPKKLER